MLVTKTITADTTLQNKINWIKNNPNICMLPFGVHSVETSADNKIQSKCCCSLDSALFSVIPQDPFAEIKHSVKNNTPHPACHACYNSEKQNGSSERFLSLMNTSNIVINNFLKEQQTNHIDYRIKFSNLCNLACRSCSPASSSKYTQVFNFPIQSFLGADASENADNWSTIISNIENYLSKFPILTLSLLGGETLIQPGVFKLLQWIDRRNLHSRLNLHITSNFTKVDNSWLEIFEKFNRIHISASIDSTNANFNYVRWPADFNKVEQNLFKILHKVKPGQFSLNIQPLWNLNNIFYINDLLDWSHKLIQTAEQDWTSQQKKFGIKLSNVNMTTPLWMTIQNLPVIYRNDLKILLEQALIHPIFDTDQHHGVIQWITGIIDFCNSTQTLNKPLSDRRLVTETCDKNIVKLTDFDFYLKETASYDVTTKNSMPTGNAKLFNILTNKHKQLYLNYVQSKI